MKNEPNEITQIIKHALADAIIFIDKAMRDGDFGEDHVWARQRKKYINLYDRFEQEKLDARLTSRED